MYRRFSGEKKLNVGLKTASFASSRRPPLQCYRCWGYGHMQTLSAVLPVGETVVNWTMFEKTAPTILCARTALKQMRLHQIVVIFCPHAMLRVLLCVTSQRNRHCCGEENMGSNPMYLHLNVHRSFEVARKHCNMVLSQSVDFISRNEPHVRDGTIISRFEGYSEVISSDRHSRSAFWVSPSMKYCAPLM